MVAFSQINSFGQIENFDDLTNIAHNGDALVCGIIEPLALANNGLKEPASWGDKGANMIIGEAQHLTLAPNYGGPGLGLFGIRYMMKINSMSEVPLVASLERQLMNTEQFVNPSFFQLVSNISVEKKPQVIFVQINHLLPQFVEHPC